MRGRQTHTHRHPQDGDTDAPKEPYVTGHTHPQVLPHGAVLGVLTYCFAVCSTCISLNVWIRKETYSEGLF